MWSSILGGAAQGILGGITGSVFGAIGANQQKRNQMELMDYQDQINAGAEQRQWQRELAAYEMNGPEAMKKRIEAAGLNPALMYGGGMAQGMGSGQMSTASAQTAGAGFAPIMGDPLAISQAEVNKATEANIRTDTEKKKAEIEQLGKTGEKTEAETAYIQKMDKYYGIIAETQIEEKQLQNDAMKFMQGKPNEVDMNSPLNRQVNAQIAKDVTQALVNNQAINESKAREILHNASARKALAETARAYEAIKQKWEELRQSGVRLQSDMETAALTRIGMKIDNSWKEIMSEEQFNQLKSLTDYYNASAEKFRYESGVNGKDWLQFSGKVVEAISNIF